MPELAHINAALHGRYDVEQRDRRVLEAIAELAREKKVEGFGR
jgi:hypothetical protein